jgi:predicted permease
MNWRRLAKIRSIFRRRGDDARMDEEMAAHIEMQARDHLEAGLGPEEARRTAGREFGRVEALKEQCREQRPFAWLDALALDARFALRQMGRNPGFSAIAVFLLALGIGANTALFTLVDAFVLKPLPIPRPGEVRQLHASDPARPGSYRLFSLDEFQRLRRDNRLLPDLVARQMTMAGWTEGENTRRVFVELASANYFSALGVRLVKGRGFFDEEEAKEIPVAILSHLTWRRMGEDPGMVGRVARLNGRDFTVIGVAPPEFTGTMAVLTPDFFVPLGMFDLLRSDLVTGGPGRLSDPNTRALTLIGRVNSGAGGAETGELRILAERLPKESSDAKPPGLELHSLPRFFSGAEPQSESGPRTAAITLLSLSVITLLVVCMNVANMLLARGLARGKEMAVRAALGAGRRRIVAQLLIEGLALAGTGAALATLLAWGLVRWLAASLLTQLPWSLALDAAPDARVLAVTSVTGAASALVFGLAPALAATRANVWARLHGQSLASGRRRWWNRVGLGQSLVGAQLAFSLALLTAGSLFIHGSIKATGANPGFETGSGILVELDGSLAAFDEARSRAIYSSVIERLAALPGVKSASLSASVPFGAIHYARQLTPPGGRADGAKPETVFSHANAIGADYFRTLGIPLLEGRPFTRAEEESHSPPTVVIIDDLLAKRFWPGKSAVGQRLALAPENKTEKPGLGPEVVGVVPWTLDNLSGEAPRPRIYFPFGQDWHSEVFIHIATDTRGLEALPALEQTIRRDLRAIDPRLPVVGVKPLREHFENNPPLWMFRTSAVLFAGMGCLALAVASIGLFGLQSCLVARRAKEIGIRVALGALRRGVVWMVMRDGIRLLAMGLAWGFFFSYAIGQALGQMLYQVSPLDPPAFIVAPALLCAAALLACWLPARRAAQVDPMIVLRNE